MNRSRAVILVTTLLAASMLANVFLLLRISRQPAPPVAVAASHEPPSLQESLDRERAKTRELSRTIDVLQQDKKLLIEDPPSKAPDRLTELRKKLRKVMKSFDHKGELPADPDLVHEFNQTAGEIRHFAATRLKDPKAYGDFLATFYELAVEGDETSLTAAQSAQIRGVIDDMASALSQLSSLQAGERQIKELELDSSTFSRITSILTDTQKAMVREAPVSQTIMMGNFIPNMFSRKDAQPIIAMTWARCYQLDNAQQALAMAAAQLFVSTVNQYETPSKTSVSTLFQDMTNPETYRYRIHCLRAQMNALKSIEPSMTPTQLDLLRKAGLQEFFFSYREEGGQLVPDK